MTGKCLETNFSLINGIKIDELEVKSFSRENIPYEFYLKESLTLKKSSDRPGFIKNLIFFDRPNANYYWENDSTWGIFDISVVNYKYRGSISKKSRSDYSYQKQYDIYPLAFKPNSWYLIDFIRTDLGENHREFLHVDDKNNFIFHKLKNVSED
ncbi:hypothetical protein C7475_11450 [Chitinophaga sp. S165]|nr:hypothetical protein C7475_11450 [Chitinophaga sp. S165]